MFASTLQNLSQMAIQESSVEIPQKTDEYVADDLVTKLQNMTSLTEEEMYVDVYSIPVKLSKRLNKYLIEAEDISKFMITNGLEDVREAIGYILEANDLVGEYHNVAVVIDECSILDEMQDLGYVVSDFNLHTPPKGLGLAMVGQQKDFAKIRNIANTKQLMDILTGRYGLPLVKRNYKSVGLLNGTVHETTEDVQIKPKKDDTILHEEDPKKKVNNITEDVEYYDEENLQESFLRPTAGERLGSSLRRLRGKSTLKDKIGAKFDKLGKLFTKGGIKKVRDWHSNPRVATRDVIVSNGMGLIKTGAIAGLAYQLHKARTPANQNNNQNPADKVDNDNVNASYEYEDQEILENMTPHERHIQYMHEVMDGMHLDD